VALSQELKGFDCVSAFSYQYGYYFAKQWSAHLALAFATGKKLDYGSWGVGLTRDFLLNRWGRPWIAELSVGWYRDHLTRNFADYTSDGEMTVFGKRFNAKRVRFGVGRVSTGFTPRIGLRHRLTNRVWVFGNAGYYLPLWSSERVFAMERSGFFIGRGSASESLSGGTVSLNYNGVAASRSGIAPLRWQTTIGLMIKY
jgi:hypothetical protein